jgi:hypothetical protein
LSDSAARHRARQTIINLVLALSASVGLVVVLVLIVPRDDSNRIKPVDYAGISQSAQTDTKLGIFTITPPTKWWSNNAVFNENPGDTVKNFTAGFVGSDTKYIQYIQAFDTNPTWVALKLNGMTPTGEFKSEHFTWQIYKSIEQHDPARTNDHLMVVNYSDQDYVLLSGVAETSEYEFFAKAIDKSIARIPELAEGK